MTTILAQSPLKLGRGSTRQNYLLRLVRQKHLLRMVQDPLCACLDNLLGRRRHLSKTLSLLNRCLGFPRRTSCCPHKGKPQSPCQRSIAASSLGPQRKFSKTFGVKLFVHQSTSLSMRRKKKKTRKKKKAAQMISLQDFGFAAVAVTKVRVAVPSRRTRLAAWQPCALSLCTSR